MSKNELFRDLPENDALTLRLQGLGSKVKAPAALTTAAITGIPYRSRASAGIHVKRISKAIVAYAMSIVLLLGGLFFVARLLDDMGDPAGTDPTDSLPPVVTTDPSETTDYPEALESITDPDPGLNFVLMTDGYYAISDFDDSERTAKIVIPSTYKGVAVKYILNSAFTDSQGLQCVIIQDGISYIGEDAFYSCNELTEVRLPNTLTDLGKRAFYETGLVSVTVPGSVQTVMNNAFAGCESLQSVKLSPGAEDLYEGVFQNCTALTEVSLPATLKRIYASAFKGCKALAEITLPASVTSIGIAAFENSGLIKATFAEPLFWNVGSEWTTDPYSAAEALRETCAHLEWKKQDNSADPDLIFRTLEDGTYGVFHYLNREVKTVIIPATYQGVPVTTICEAAFMECTNLQSITLPEGLTTIESEAFYGCTALTRITLPSTLTEIGEYAFWECPIGSLTIPASLETIGNYAFSGCREMTSLKLEKGVKTIGVGAFENNIALKSITLPDGLQVIDVTAFAGCNKLQTLTIPASVTFIGDYAFGECRELYTVTIQSPDGWILTRGDDTVVADPLIDANQNAQMLRDQYAYYTWKRDSAGEEYLVYTMQDDDTWAVSGVDSTEAREAVAHLTIPATYQGYPVTAIRYDGFERYVNLKSITLPDSITQIGSNAFDNCVSLTEIDLPDGLLEIGEWAFYNAGLVSITVPGGVTKIGNMTFCGCDQLTRAVLEEGVYELGVDVFSECTSLTSVSLPSTLRIMDDGVFSGCTALAEIALPAKMSVLENGVFSRSGIRSIRIPEGITTLWGCLSSCPDLVSVELPDSLRWINPGAFSGCTSLKEITIPANVESIGYTAFASCSSLEEITIPKMTRKIGFSAFQGCTSLRSVTFESAENWSPAGALTDPAKNAQLLTDTYRDVEWQNLS